MTRKNSSQKLSVCEASIGGDAIFPAVIGGVRLTHLKAKQIHLRDRRKTQKEKPW